MTNAHSDYYAEAEVYLGRVLIRLHRTSLGRTEQAMYFHVEDLDEILSALEEPQLRADATKMLRQVKRRADRGKQENH